MTRPLLTALAILALAVGLAACAGGDGDAAGSPDRGTDRRAVQERTIAYLDAYLRGDGRRACSLLEPGYRARQDARARAGGFDGCAGALAALGPELFSRLPAGSRDAARRRYLRAERVRVELDGERATAGFAADRDGRVVTRLAFARAGGGDWRITRLGVRRRSP